MLYEMASDSFSCYSDARIRSANIQNFVRYDFGFVFLLFRYQHSFCEYSEFYMTWIWIRFLVIQMPVYVLQTFRILYDMDLDSFTCNSDTRIRSANIQNSI